MHVAVRPARRTLPLLLAATLVLGGCGGGDDDDPEAEEIRALPTITQNDVVDAPDVAAANELCRKYQKRKPELVTQLRFKIKGSPSVTCIVQ